MDKNAQDDEKKNNFFREHSDKVIFFSFTIIAMAIEFDNKPNIKLYFKNSPQVYVISKMIFISGHYRQIYYN